MSSFIQITKSGNHLQGNIHLPASKSITNRNLMLLAYAGHPIPPGHPSESGDSQLMRELLQRIRLAGTPEEECYLDAENAGTVFRFLVPFLAMRKGLWVLGGSGRMLERPVAPLVDALRSLGAEIRYLGKSGYPPLFIRGKDVEGGEVSIDGSVSSQYISALMMAGPFLTGGLVIHRKGREVSQPYIRMTAELMKKMGLSISMDSQILTLPPGTPARPAIVTEPDWTAASYWYEMLSLADSGSVLLKDLYLSDLQGDSIAAELFFELGVHSEEQEDGILITKSPLRSRSFRFDFSDNPDLAMTMAVSCAGLGIDARLRGLTTLAVKESDRLSALYAELTRQGYAAEKGDDCLHLRGERTVRSKSDEIVRTYNDHRIAMAFAPLALKQGRIRIEKPSVVGKSYPSFWDDLRATGFQCQISGGD